MILILFLTCQFGFSQSDCVIFFKFSGTIKSDSLKIDKIYLPSTKYLVGYERFEDKDGFYILDIDSHTFSKEIISHMSSDFCMDIEDIINQVFKRVEKYPIRIITKMKDHTGKYIMYETVIPINQIKFVIGNDKKLEIILPQIDINKNVAQHAI